MKLFAFDIDGTLIDDRMENGEFVVYPEVVVALNALLDRGDAILFASGRSLPGLIQFSKFLVHQDHLYYSTANGTCLYDHLGQLLYSSYIPYSVFLKMFALYGGHPDWSYLCYTLDNAVGFLGQANFAYEEARFNAMECRDLNNVVFPEGTLLQKASMTTGNTDAHSLPLYPELQGYQAYATSKFFFEIVAFDVSKAKTVELVQQRLGLASNDVYAFGDGDNDISMIKEFQGTATNTASEGAKAAASYVCPSATDRGVVEALREHWKLL
jgi:Cof subfamily protein (haloacid dehalogenase superfamily)